MIRNDLGTVVDHGFRIRTEPLLEMVYRYRAIDERLEQILTQDELYFATPSSCNDPFDCRIELSIDDPLKGLQSYLYEARIWARLARHTKLSHSDNPLVPDFLADMDNVQLTEHSKKVYERLCSQPEMMQQIKDRIENTRDRVGICCFAGRPDNLLMHAHYADQHKGCCLEFQIRDQKGDRRSIFEEEGMCHFLDVRYDDHPPSVHVYETLTAEAIDKIILTKHTRWAYEEEVRIVRWKGPGPVRYRRDTLTGLIFSCKTSEKDMSRVFEWLGPRPGVSLSKAVLKKDMNLSLVPL